MEVRSLPPTCTALECALEEAAAARGLQRLEQLTAQSGAARDGDAVGVASVARSAAAMVEMERLAATSQSSAIDLCSLLNRIATLEQLAAPGGSTMATRVASAQVPSGFARGVAAVVLDLFRVVGPMDRCVERPVLLLTASIAAGDLVITVAAPPGAEVPDAAAARCMERASRIARLLGGTAVRGFDDGLHLAGMVCPLPGSVEEAGS